MNIKCNICDKKLTHMDIKHVKTCNKINKTKLNNTEIKYNFIKYNFEYISDIDNLKKQYLINKKSIPDIVKEYNITYSYIQFLLKFYNIKQRNISESSLISRDKFKKTCIEKYGVDNISKLDIIKNKKKKTFLKNYGVDNIWKSKEYIKWLDEYMLGKFGKKRITNSKKVSIGNIKYWENLTDDKYNKFCDNRSIYMINKWKNISDEDKQDFIKKCKNYWTDEKRKEHRIKRWENLTDDEKNIQLSRIHNKHGSLLEVRISNILKLLNIDFDIQVKIKFKSVDFLLKNSKIIIEVQGDFWHANPLLYKSDDILKFPVKHVTAGEIWKRDNNKKKILENAGYCVIYIWEYNIRKLKDEKLMEFIINELLKIT